MTLLQVSKVTAGIIFSISVLAQAQEHSPQIARPTAVSEANADAIKSEDLTKTSTPVALIYRVFETAVTPRPWCLCALSKEEEIFLRQYEP
ncbi:hypothetical protein [Stenotrophobium rhamnosiphilum]|uniref:hypothetical protein n=1 Tax=Stenotrophobium rhamnosiphilum TaxID=2029166 RepID=UPI000D39FFB0|nr:hypothetical protein [Stenotrophobium rhamnosiphilum]